jgi:hypothetical protein
MQKNNQNLDKDSKYPPIVRQNALNVKRKFSQGASFRSFGQAQKEATGGQLFLPESLVKQAYNKRR